METSIPPQNAPNQQPHRSANLSARMAADKVSQDQIAKDILVETAKPISSGRLPEPEMVDAQSMIHWENVIPIIAFHLLIPLAFFSYFFSWWGLLFLPIGNYFFTSLGIGAGYHRLLTHRGFDCPKWFEYALALLGVCSFQDSPARWALVHRVHHQHSDSSARSAYAQGQWLLGSRRLAVYRQSRIEHCLGV